MNEESKKRLDDEIMAHLHDWVYLRDDYGSLILPVEGKITLHEGWEEYCPVADQKIVLKHNKDIDDAIAYEKKQQKLKNKTWKNSHYNTSQRATKIANKISKEIISELEVTSFISPSDEPVSIKQTKEKIAFFMDRFKLHKTILEHRDLIVEEGEDVGAIKDNNLSELEQYRKNLIKEEKKVAQ